MKTRFLRRFAVPMTSVLSLAILVSTSPYAGEKEDELIDKIVAAYGGDAISNLSTVRVEDHYLNPTTGQNHAADQTEVAKSQQVLLWDIKNGKFSYDTWNEGRSGSFQGLTIGNGEKAYTLNFSNKTYGPARSEDPYAIAGGTMRTADAILVRELNSARDKASLGGDEMYLNRTHHVVNMPFPLSPDLKLFVDAKTHRVSKMVRVNPQLGNLDYIYADYKTDNGITYASSINFFVAGQPQLLSTKHELSFNVPANSSEFDLPADFKTEGVRIDTSDGYVTKLSDRVYHVGQGNAFTLFADTNIGTVAAGGYGGLSQRFDRYQSESNLFKPLTHQIVTHHHSDHIGGVGEAVALGAKLVTVEENVDAIKASTNPNLADSDFFTIGKRLSLGEGKNRVEVYEVSTIHSASFLVSYVPSVKTIFIADHFGSPFAETLPQANPNTLDMLDALISLDIDIKKIATAHNARIYTLDDMKKSVAAYKPTSCEGNRPICK